MIVIFGSKKDPHCIELKDEIENRNKKCIILSTDKEDLLSTEFTVLPSKKIINIIQDNICLDINEIKVAYVTQPIHSLFSTREEYFSQELKFWYFSWRDCIYGLYRILSKNSIVINSSVSLAIDNQNKCYYHYFSKSDFLKFPDSIISNNKKEINKFITLHEDCIIKTLHQMQLSYQDEPTMLLATKIHSSDLSEFNSFGECPIFVQRYIDKKFDLRLTIIGSDVICCKIDASKSIHGNIDWRAYDLPNTPHTSYKLEKNIKKEIIEICNSHDLEYATIDLCVDMNDKYWILDINPFGKFLWIEDATGLKITKKLADFIILKHENNNINTSINKIISD